MHPKKEDSTKSSEEGNSVERKRKEKKEKTKQKQKQTFAQGVDRVPRGKVAVLSLLVIRSVL